MLTGVDFATGEITFNDLVFIDPTVPLVDQVDDLKEDMLQVSYPDESLIDVGWYPSFDPEGKFRVVVVRDFNWESPIYRVWCASVADLREALLEAVAIVTEGNR